MKQLGVFLHKSLCGPELPFIWRGGGDLWVKRLDEKAGGCSFSLETACLLSWLYCFMFAPTLPYQVEAGAWDPSWGPSSDTRGGVSYLLLGGMGSWLPKWCPLTRGRGIVPYYPWAGMTALTPYLAVTPVRWGGPSAWPPQRGGTLAPHVGVGGRPVFSRGVCRAEGGYCLKGLCFARLPLSWSFGWKGFHWGILVAATGVSELLLPSALNLRYMRQKENPGRSPSSHSWGLEDPTWPAFSPRFRILPCLPWV